jgi:beta-N-acetylhexosaminidase
MLPIVVGIPGPVLLDEEREVLEQVRPAGVVLFDRNIRDAEQVRDLTASLRDLEPEPFICVDLEGGRVNRLTALWGRLPAPARAARAGRKAVRALGDAAGAACRALGIQINFAPVVDLAVQGGRLVVEERCWHEDPERVRTFAEVFAKTQRNWCVSSCLKHYPGLGAVQVDTHQELPVLEVSASSLERHLIPHLGLSESVGAVMVGHVITPALGDSERPASLSKKIIERARALPGAPVVLSDDLDMGALSRIGSLEELAVTSLRAGAHGVLVCRSFNQLESIARLIRETADSEPSLRIRVNEAVSRLGTMRRELCRTGGSVPAPDDATVAQLWQQARSEAGE